MFKALSVVSSGVLLTLGACLPEEGEGSLTEDVSALEAGRNPAGIAETFHVTGGIDFTNPFFQQLGTNARSCATCHASNQGWTITASRTRRLFRQTDGLDPLFMLHDEGSRPDADISTLAARSATFATLINRGLTRFGRTIPATGEFVALMVEDPSGFGTPAAFTAFRRPTPTANEAKVANILWNGGPHPDIPATLGATLNGASNFHLQRDPAVPVPPELRVAAATFQMGLFFAQTVDNLAGRLDLAGARGGPQNLAAQPFYVGINDIQGLDPQGHPFTRKVFDIFDAWAIYNRNPGHGDCALDRGRGAARASIYRGQEVFNNYEFDITGVPGLNDVLAQATVRGTCSTCHNAPNVGGHSVFRMFDIGTANEASCDPSLPMLTLQHKTTMETRRVCDMGRGGNGVWADIGRFRAPPLRGLAARAPYFHDGQAGDIADVVRYYQKRFNMGLNHIQKRDLEAFLGAL